MKDFGENVYTYGVLNVLRFRGTQVRSAAREGKGKNWNMHKLQKEQKKPLCENSSNSF